MSWVSIGAAGVSTGLGMLTSKKQKSPGFMDLRTAEQKAAQASLGQLGQTGSFGDLTLGQAYSGSLGDFTQTDTQRLSGNRLYDLINSGEASGYGTARNTLTGLANNQFNPDDPSSGYAAFSRQVARAGGVANDALNREAAITGDRYSSSIGRNKADLGAQMNDQLLSKLGELYNSAQDRSLQAAQGLGNLESQVGNNTRANLDMGFDPNAGGLQNTLNNAQAMASYKEFERQRNEKLKQIDVLSGSAGMGGSYAMEASPVQNNPFAGLIAAAAPAVSGQIGNFMNSQGVKQFFNSRGVASQVGRTTTVL